MFRKLDEAKLTTATRNSLPKNTFAGPDRSYPVPDKSHAANAKARASQAVNAGRMSKGEEEKIDAKANKVLGKTNEETMTNSVRDIITATMENNAIGVQSAIHTAIGEKIHDALEAKRIVVAQNLVGIGEGLDEELGRKAFLQKRHKDLAWLKRNKSSHESKISTSPKKANILKKKVSTKNNENVS